MRTDPDAWRYAAMGSNPEPAWLSADAPHGDVVLSTRTRIMRNLSGYRFPHHASRDDLRAIQGTLVRALKGKLESVGRLTHAEHDYLVGCRLVSPDFKWSEPGRTVLLDPSRMTSAMVNEEDHLRVQVLTAGWSAERCDQVVTELVDSLESKLPFAWSPKFGYLAASPYNAGAGRRISAMFHLIGLAQIKRLPVVLKAVAARGLTARGLFGESSRAVGAFVQISITNSKRGDFVGAGEYLLEAERVARQEAGREVLLTRADQAIQFAITSPVLSLSDALRVLGWARWAATEKGMGTAYTYRDVDSWVTALEIRNSADEDKASRQRANFLRARLDV